MFVLTKPEALTTAAHISTEVERKLQPLSYDINRDDTGVTYKISSFAPGIRYSMFLPFAEVSLMRECGTWVLRLKATKLLLVPFALFAVALLVFRFLAPLGLEGIVIGAAVPTVLVVLAVSEARLRLGAWWKHL
ncbi:MAG: hypothetical protein V4513_08890 [Pseudomonadota bacterium]